MNHSQILASVQHIRPSAEFALRGDKLDWLDKEQDEPTADEIEAGWISYQAKVKADKANELAKKAAAEAKLVALGLTVEDLKALGLG